jgi:ribonuclease Y
LIGIIILLAGYAVFLQIKTGKQQSQLDSLKDSLTQEIDNVKEDAQKKIKQVEDRLEIQKKEALLSAKEALQSERSEFEQEVKQRRAEISRLENRLLEKEEKMEAKIQAVTDREADLAKKLDELYEKEDYLAELVQKHTQELERISGMTADEAKKVLLEQMEKELKLEAAQLIRENEAYIKETSGIKAREILSSAMQRCAIEQVVESTVSVVNLPNDEMKGRIIGREGRNIRALEMLTGVDLIIDDTPEAVVVSSFNPMRREIARITIENLISDGRIHPVRIEDMVKKAEEQIEENMPKEGEAAALSLGVLNLPPEINRLLGKLNFRTSYGQNVLKHSLEVGQLAATIALEIGANVELAKRAGLLHDIGKAVDQQQEGTHIQLGVDIARKYGESEEVIHCIEAHHDDVPARTVEAELIKIADALSAGRPGARRDTLEDRKSVV